MEYDVVVQSVAQSVPRPNAGLTVPDRAPGLISTDARPSEASSARARPPVIDARTIKTILYLGLKGDIALGGGSAEPGVDAYA
jgi:hypothetical protein